MKHPKYNPKPYPTTQSMSPTIFNLPQDILFNILSRLPTKSLTHFLPVSTSSPPLISNPSFTHLHLTTTITENHRILIYYESTDYLTHFYSLKPPQTIHLQPPYKTLHGYLQIVGSDKGLICLFDTNYYSNVGMVILWNPCIQKFRIVGDPHDVSDQFSHFVFGFGFVSRSCEFKVVEIGYDLEDFKRKNYVSVYSVRSNSWEKKNSVGASAPCYLNKGWSSSVFVNGFVNWLGFKDEGAGAGACRYVMAFDLENERFRVFGLPESISIVPSYNQVTIDSFGEEGESLSLSLCARYVEVNVEKWDVWVMGDYGVVESWKKVFVVSQPLLIPPLLMKNDREVLIAMEDGRLMLLDAIKNEVKNLETVGLPRSFRAIRYTASLAMLHG
ncbi:F-box/kelch-repeat protein At3g06240-like [Bidens hawaiensis]|uniref:F-box/kelch-repeat protein At3g06240-like n=1 Tax=Bidens hawaiensis TaxID=980011 RepID=UPI0040496518